MMQGNRVVADTVTKNVRAEYSNVWCLLALVLIPAILLLNGCTGLVKASSQGAPAVFQLNPSSISFGTITVGKKATQSVSVANTGTVAVNITQAAVSNPQFSLSGMALPMSLASGQTGNFSIGITPSAAGNITGTLTVTGDGGSSPVVVNLSATASGSTQPQLTVAPTSVSFGTVTNGHTGTANLVLSNTGSADLTVSVITMTGAEFGISGITTPKTITAGQSVQAAVTFSPTVSGASTGNIAVISNDATNPTKNVPLTGTGTNSTGQTFSVSGTITGAGGNGATVTLGGALSATTTANSAGAYTFTSLANGSYTVTPSHTGYTFSPASQNATVNGANVTVPAFTATAGTFSISGTITGAGGNGATVTLGGASSATTTANSAGAYTFTSLANGSYPVTPSHTGYTFSPSSQNATVSSANVSGVNFTATGQTYSISGTVSPTAGGSGATLTLSGASTASTTASSSGNFSFTGLINGNYVVTPTNTGYTFAPATQAVTINGANVTGTNFTATVAAPTFSISGTISGGGGIGATVTLSGASSATATANSSGAYSFTGLPNGSYTVTPSHTGATYTPTNQSTTINGANITGLNFTSTTTSTVVFYDDFSAPTLSPSWFALNVSDNVNGEQECYRPSQVTTGSSGLTITAIPQTCSDGKPYTSGAVVWAPPAQGGFNFTYGTIEYKAKFAGGTGTWPAIWLLGAQCQPTAPTIYNENTCNWPNSGSNEIDITEVASPSSSAGSTAHTSPMQWYDSPNQGWIGANGSSCPHTNVTDVSTNFHVYDLSWTPTALTFSIDGVQTCQLTGNIQIPTLPMYLIINVAVGGNWGGSVNNATLPQSTVVQYVKVTQP